MQISTAGHFGEWKMMIPFDGSSNLRRRGHCLEPKWGFLHRRDNYVSTTGLSEMELRSRQSAVSCGLWSAIFFSLFFYLFLGSFLCFTGILWCMFLVCVIVSIFFVFCFYLFFFTFLMIRGGVIELIDISHYHYWFGVSVIAFNHTIDIKYWRYFCINYNDDNDSYYNNEGVIMIK